jgi:PAS domain-containing protein
VEAQRPSVGCDLRAPVATPQRRVIQRAPVDVAEHKVIRCRVPLAPAHALERGGSLLGQRHATRSPRLRGSLDAGAHRASDRQCGPSEIHVLPVQRQQLAEAWGSSSVSAISVAAISASHYSYSRIHPTAVTMKRESNSGRLGFWTLPLFIGGIIASLLVTLVVEHSDSSKSRQAFKASSEEIASTLELGIQHEQDLVVSVSAFVADNPEVSNKQFGQWIGSLQAFQRYPEITALGHAVVVQASQLPAFAAASARDPVSPLPGGVFRVLPPGRRRFYCFQAGAVSRSPQESFPAGYDFCAAGGAIGPNGLLAAQRSGASSYVPIRLGATTLLAVQTPVYRGGAVPATVAARRRDFVGWVGVVAIPSVLLSRALTAHPHTGVTFGYHVGSSNAVFHAGKAPSGAQSIAISLHNGWTVRISAGSPSGILAHWNTLLVLVGGILLSLLVGLLGSARRRRAEAQTEELVLRQSEQRMNALLHNSSDMITVVAIDATVIYQTDSVRSVLGRADRATGREAHRLRRPGGFSRATEPLRASRHSKRGTQLPPRRRQCASLRGARNQPPGSPCVERRGTQYP